MIFTVIFFGLATRWRFRGGCWGDAGEAEGRCRRWRLAGGCSNNGDEGELGVDGGDDGGVGDFGDWGGVGDFGDGCNLGDWGDAGQDLGVDGVEFTLDSLAVMSRIFSW